MQIVKIHVSCHAIDQSLYDLFSLKDLFFQQQRTFSWTLKLLSHPLGWLGIHNPVFKILSSVHQGDDWKYTLSNGVLLFAFYNLLNAQS